MRRGWHRNRYGHGLAARGVRTKVLFPKGKFSSFPLQKLDEYTIQQVRLYNDLAKDREWIAEFDSINGSIVINDVQFNDCSDESYLKWDTGDEYKNVGYIHYHPPGIVPKFSAQDFVLGVILHGRRRNRSNGDYTYMGLVTPDFIKIIAIRPKVERKRQFERYIDSDGRPETTKKLEGIVENMRRNGELVELRTVPLSSRYRPVRGIVV